jgi:hypothetical protein
MYYVISVVVLHQIPDKVPPLAAGIDKNDFVSAYGTGAVNRYPIVENSLFKRRKSQYFFRTLTLNNTSIQSIIPNIIA